MIASLVLLTSGAVAVGAATAAIVSDPTNDYRERAAQAEKERAGAAGERRVARALARAGIPAVHDLTLPDRAGGTHQIDHIAAAGDCLYVLETKNWHGTLLSDPAAQHWTLQVPFGATPHPYNPLLQNATHEAVVRALTRAPVQGLVIEVGRTQHRYRRPRGVLPLHAAIVEIAKNGPPSARAMNDLENLLRIKEGPQEATLVAAHRRLTMRQPSEKTRRLWRTAAIATLVFIIVLATRFTLGRQYEIPPREDTMEQKAKVIQTISHDMNDLMRPGFVIEVDKADVERLGLAEETALSEEDAWESNAGVADTNEARNGR